MGWGGGRGVKYSDGSIAITAAVRMVWEGAGRYQFGSDTLLVPARRPIPVHNHHIQGNASGKWQGGIGGQEKKLCPTWYLETPMVP